MLVHIYPKADIPVFQVSLDVKKTTEEHLQVGRNLQKLREEGVLIFGSGNIVHNLRTINWKDPNGAYAWAADFDLQIKKALDSRDEKTLTNYESMGEMAKLSVPTAEHYLPLLYVVGASNKEDTLTYPFECYQMGSLSMRSVLYS